MISDLIQKELGRSDSRAVHLREVAEGLRRNAVEAEVLLRDRLPEFTFQQPLGRFVIDFFNPETGVIVEIDGPYHWATYRKNNQKDISLYNKLGVCTIRVSSDEVEEDPDKVVRKIRAWKPTPPKEVDEEVFRRPWDYKKQARLNRFLQRVIKAWEPRPRHEMLRDYEYLKQFSEEGLEYQTRFLKKMKERVDYWPYAGYIIQHNKSG